VRAHVRVPWIIKKHRSYPPSWFICLIPIPRAYFESLICSLAGKKRGLASRFNAINQSLGLIVTNPLSSTSLSEEARKSRRKCQTSRALDIAGQGRPSDLPRAAETAPKASRGGNVNERFRADPASLQPRPRTSDTRGRAESRANPSTKLSPRLRLPAGPAAPTLGTKEGARRLHRAQVIAARIADLMPRHACTRVRAGIPAPWK